MGALSLRISAVFIAATLHLVIFSSITQAAPTTVSSGATASSTAYNNGRKIVKDSAGNLYVAYTKGATTQIYVSKSTDNGGTWNDMGGAPIQNIAGYVQNYPAIAVDQSNNLHVVWMGTDASSGGYNRIKYSKYNGSSWSAYSNIDGVAGNYSQIRPAIAVDGANNLHVVWAGSDSVETTNTQIKYSKYISGWSGWINISVVSGYTQTSPSIAIDSSNYPHVAWMGTDAGNISYDQIKYSKYNGASWTAWTNIATIASPNEQSYPQIAIDGSNIPHVVWNGQDGSSGTCSANPCYQIKYSRYSGSWSAWINVKTISNYNQWDPTIVIDNTGRLIVIWSGTDGSYPTYDQIKYSYCTTTCTNSGNWAAYVNKTSSGSNYQQYPAARWSRYWPNGGDLMWAWCDGTTVTFDKDGTYQLPGGASERGYVDTSW